MPIALSRIALGMALALEAIRQLNELSLFMKKELNMQYTEGEYYLDIRSPKSNTVRMTSPVSEKVGQPCSGPLRNSSGEFSQLARLIDAATSGELSRAIAISYELRPVSKEILNARAVCMMRLGQAEEPLRIYRDMLLPRGSTLLREMVPDYMKVNFATALLLVGQVSGCLDVLGEVKERENVSVLKLRKCIRVWQSQLSLLAWLDWKINCIQPRKNPVAIDFVPGEFGPISDDERQFDGQFA